MYGEVRTRLQAELDEIREAGPWKGERVIQGPQGAQVAVAGREVLNFCANNYLGLANDPGLIRAAQEGLARWGFGMASVRFICGTQSIHTEWWASPIRSCPEARPASACRSAPPTSPPTSSAPGPPSSRSAAPSAPSDPPCSSSSGKRRRPFKKVQMQGGARRPHPRRPPLGEPSRRRGERIRRSGRA